MSILQQIIETDDKRTWDYIRAAAEKAPLLDATNIGDLMRAEFVRRMGRPLPAFGTRLIFHWVEHGKPRLLEGLFERVTWEFEIKDNCSRAEFKLLIRMDENNPVGHWAVDPEQIIME